MGGGEEGGRRGREVGEGREGGKEGRRECEARSEYGSRRERKWKYEYAYILVYLGGKVNQHDLSSADFWAKSHAFQLPTQQFTSL